MTVCPKCDNIFEPLHSRMTNDFTIMDIIEMDSNNVSKFKCSSCGMTDFKNFELVNSGMARNAVVRVFPVGGHIPKEDRKFKIEISCKSCKTTFTKKGKISQYNHY